MELDNEVTKLKMLEASYKNNHYKLEDKVTKEYPRDIMITEKLITAVKQDILMVEPRDNGEEKFTYIIINGERIEDRKIAGEKLMEAIKKISIYEKTVIGSYRNLVLEVGYNLTKNEYKFMLKGKTEYFGTFGTSADGNIVRLDNAIEKIPERLKRFEEKLDETKKQFIQAKAELEKPFGRAEELKEKIIRLAELNRLLEMDDDKERQGKTGYTVSDKLAEKIVTFMENYDSSFEYGSDIAGQSDRKEYIQTVKNDFLNGDGQKYSETLERLKNVTTKAGIDASAIQSELIICERLYDMAEEACSGQDLEQER